MDGTDSRIDQAYAFKDIDYDTPSLPRSSGTSAPQSPHKPRPSLTLSPSTKTQDTDSHKLHIVSSKRSTTRSRRQNYSSENSTSSTSMGKTPRPSAHASATYPSSSTRRTSCTLVDPSRPTWHYRIKSSQTVPSAGGDDVDDVLALHFRSCCLFQTQGQARPKSQNTLGVNNSYPGPESTKDTDGGATDKKEDFDISLVRVVSSSSAAPQHSTDNNTNTNNNISSNTTTIYPPPPQDQDSDPSSPPSEEGLANNPRPATTTNYYMTPHTRRKQYAKMDKANSGVRTLLRKVVPKCMAGPPPPRFFQEDRSDVGSVRRYRIEMEDDEDGVEEEEDQDVEDEKTTGNMKKGVFGGRGGLRKRPHTAGAELDVNGRTKIRGKRWWCF